jgi:hypothetical protein
MQRTHRLKCYSMTGIFSPILMATILLTSAPACVHDHAQELKPEEAFGHIQEYFDYLQSARHAKEPIWTNEATTVELRIRALLAAKGATPAEIRSHVDLIPSFLDFIRGEKGFYLRADSAFLNFYAAGIDSGRVHLLPADLSVLDEEMKVFKYFEDLLQKRRNDAAEAASRNAAYDIMEKILNERMRAPEHVSKTPPDSLVRGAYDSVERRDLVTESALWGTSAEGYSIDIHSLNSFYDLRYLGELFDGFSRILQDPRLRAGEIRPAAGKLNERHISLLEAAERIEAHKATLDKLLGEFNAKYAKGLPYGFGFRSYQVGFQKFLQIHRDTLAMSYQVLLQKSYATERDLEYLDQGMVRLNQEWSRVTPVMQAMANRFGDPDPLWQKADRLRDAENATWDEKSALRLAAFDLRDEISRPADQLGKELAEHPVFLIIRVGGKVIEIRFRIDGLASKIPLLSATALSELPVGVPLVADVVYDAPNLGGSCPASNVNIRVGKNSLQLDVSPGADLNICTSRRFVIWPVYADKNRDISPPQ